MSFALVASAVFVAPVTAVQVERAAAGAAALAAAESCESRVNDNQKKLLECVTLEGVREH